MQITLKPMDQNHRKEVMDIFNYYIENSYAAYPERSLPVEFFERFLEMSRLYPAIVAEDEDGVILGFGMLRPYNPMPVFARTAEITYFIKPEATSRGIGKMMLDYLIEEGKKKGVATILAGISSLNPGSIHFHARNGFTECGRLKSVGKKKDQLFDVVYMQRMV